MNITDAKWSAGVLTLHTTDPEAVRFSIQFKPGEYEIVKREKSRTLNANGLYWKLLTGLAKAIDVPLPHMHNLMLRRYGQVKLVGGNVVYVFLRDTEEVEKQVDNDETTHLRPTSQTKPGKDGTYRAYMLLRGSSEYNTSEFSRLLDGLISECKEVGLDVLSDKDRALLEAWDGS